MAKVESLGIKKVDALHYYVNDLERSRRFYTEVLDFEELGVSDARLEDTGKQRSAAFGAGDCRVVCSQPQGEGGRAWSFLRKHPAGIGSMSFEVEDIDKTFRLLEERGGTAITGVQTFEEAGLKMFAIATPFGDTLVRFVERRPESLLYPGFVPHGRPTGGKNGFGFSHWDHITSNFRTMAPALLWMEHVLGLERYWDVEFHTTDVDPKHTDGSGLRSQVMYDPSSGLKFANNEPFRPSFRKSQIHLFTEDHRGDGVQHAALAVTDIITVVRTMRERGARFMPTPGTYYDVLPERIELLGIGSIEEEISVLRELEILVDGNDENSYLLQIFMQEAAGLYGDPNAGPFFYEIIERKGDQGFGAGNFRALFESIERAQKEEGRL